MEVMRIAGLVVSKTESADSKDRDDKPSTDVALECITLFSPARAKPW